MTGIGVVIGAVAFAALILILVWRDRSGTAEDDAARRRRRRRWYEADASAASTNPVNFDSSASFDTIDSAPSHRDYGGLDGGESGGGGGGASWGGDSGGEGTDSGGGDSGGGDSGSSS
jgi:hypothetical protein